MAATWIVRVIVAGLVIYGIGEAMRYEYLEFAGTVQQQRDQAMPEWRR